MNIIETIKEIWHKNMQLFRLLSFLRRQESIHWKLDSRFARE